MRTNEKTAWRDYVRAMKVIFMPSMNFMTVISKTLEKYGRHRGVGLVWVLSDAAMLCSLAVWQTSPG